jgi:biopolymer transport protein ExbD
MNLGGKRKESPDVNLTPLIDVVFLLLIFFMVSTTFKKDAEIKIDLPEASAKAVETKEKVVEIVIDREGNYFLGNKQLVNQKLQTMKQVLSKQFGNQSDKPLIIRADSKAPHGAVVMVMDAARQLGILNLSIATSEQTN